jgi:hypothetical protein
VRRRPSPPSPLPALPARLVHPARPVRRARTKPLRDRPGPLAPSVPSLASASTWQVTARANPLTCVSRRRQTFALRAAALRPGSRPDRKATQEERPSPPNPHRELINPVHLIHRVCRSIPRPRPAHVVGVFFGMGVRPPPPNDTNVYHLEHPPTHRLT